MLNVANKKVITELAKATYKANKKRNILTITAIFLTTFLICAVISIGMSYWNTISLRQQRMNGMDYDIQLTEPREEQVNYIRNMESVQCAGVSVKCAVLSKYEQRELEKIRVFWVDAVCWKKQVIPALEAYAGTYPEKENEIMLSKGALRSMGIKSPKVGMTLPVTYETLNKDTDGEIQKEFILSGWFLDYTGKDSGYISESFYKETGVKQTDFTQGALKITLKNPLYSEQDIIDMQNQISIEENQIIDADYDTISNFCRLVLGLIVVLFLVFVSGYLFIYNMLYISVNKDIRYYGQLKTLGATSKQLKNMLYKQILWNLIIGIPPGLLLSGFVGKFLIPAALHAVNPTLRAKEIGDASVLVFAAAAGFAFITTLTGSKKPMEIVEKCSPIEAVKYIGILKDIKARKSRGGDIASMVRQNLFRDKKQFLVILLSLSLAMSLFMVINVIVSSNNAKNILNQTYDCDMKVLNQTLLSDNEKQVITEALIEKIKKTDGVRDVRVLLSATAKIPYQEAVYGEYYKELYASRYSPGSYEKDMQLYKENKNGNYDFFTCRIVGVDELEFEKLNQGMKEPLDRQKFENGEIAFASKGFTTGDNGIPGKTVFFSIPTALQPKQEEGITIKALLFTFPAYYSAGYNPDLVVSKSYLEKLMGENALIEMIKIDYEEAFSKNTEAALLELLTDNKELSLESKLQRCADMKNTENQVTLLGNSIGIIIMLLSMLNFVNMMSAGIQNRTRELAVLESIGMTRKQIRKMITLEGLSYAIMGIILSIWIGLPASWLAFKSFNRYTQLKFSIPVRSDLLLFGVITAACVLTARFVLKRSEKETIIALLRKADN